ncbi:hypothetical protein [Devosia lacusdianchii]|jgi:hypothetical protein|nr:hypothetical protein [Devosia sp. JXJ CY 41]
MSSILTILSRLLAVFAPADRAPTDPDTLSLRDWADLPVHHPLSDRAPC